MTTPNNLSFWKDRIVWTSPRFTAGISTRPAIAVIVGCYEDVHVTTQRGHCHSGRVLIVAPDVPRSLRSGQAHYNVNLDPAHRICRHLREVVLKGHEVLDMSPLLDKIPLTELRRAAAEPQNCAEGYRISEQLLDTLFPDTRFLAPIDPRIDLVATWLSTHLPKQINLGELTALSGLSAGRLVHLFTDELGISLRRYLLWAKMRWAMANLPESAQSLTDIAHRVGFADSAHMSRTFKKYFALTPSFLGSELQVQITRCDAK